MGGDGFVVELGVVGDAEVASGRIEAEGAGAVSGGNGVGEGSTAVVVEWSDGAE